MRQIHGVGALTVRAFALTLEYPSRFAKSKQVGPFVNRCPPHARAVFRENGPLVETRRVLSLLYSLNAESSFLVKVHPFREKL